MTKLRPTQDVYIVIRLDLDAHSIAQRAYEKAWLAAWKKSPLLKGHLELHTFPLIKNLHRLVRPSSPPHAGEADWNVSIRRQCRFYLHPAVSDHLLAKFAKLPARCERCLRMI